MSSTFETLPDEILMIIFGYSDDVCGKFRAFIGLNQRLNNILIDKRLHLLADYLHINKYHVNLDNYYHSDVFQEVSRQLCSINSPANENQLYQCFQSLISFHIGEKLQQNLEKFRSIRRHLTRDEIDDVDNKLRKTFSDLRYEFIKMSNIDEVQLLIHKHGAQLQYDPDKFIYIVTQILLCHLYHKGTNTRDM